jgi:hypothetical protein
MSETTFCSDPALDAPGLNGASADPGYIGPAIVVGIEEDTPGRLLVVLPGDPERRWAQPATRGAEAVIPGQRVLVALGAQDAAYIIGVLDVVERRVTSREGVSASVLEDERGHRIEVRGAGQEMLFEYHPSSRSARLHLPAGDLHVTAPNGDLTFSAGGAVRLRGQTIDLAATSSVRLFVHDAAARVLNAVRLGRQSTAITTRRARIEAERADFAVGQTTVTGERLATNVSLIRTTAERIETVAETVTERFGTLCQRVSGLVQARAGRLRMLVAGSWHGRAAQADLRTKETFKVDGKRIHLG